MKKNHGGFRVNSGRKKKIETEKKTRLTIWVSQSVKLLITDTAKMMRISAGKLIELIISD